MTAYDWQVYKHNGTSWVELTNVQGLAFSYGQRQLTDTWSPPVWTLTGRLPDDLGTVNIGDWVAVITSGSPEFIYKVTNYEVFYGIEPSMDVWSMQIESGFSALARSVISTSWPSGQDAGTAASLVGQAAEVSIRGDGIVNEPLGNPISGQTITNENGFDVFTRIARTSGTIGTNPTYTVPYYVVYPVNNSGAIYRQQLYWKESTVISPTGPSCHFTDAPTLSVQAVYDGLNFGSLNLNYATKVVVTPVGGSPQTAGSGNTAYETTTYSLTNAEAYDVANRYAGLLAASDSVPLSITYTKEQQTSTATLPSQIAYLNGTAYVQITFRGTDYYATILGQDITSTPGSTRVTLYLCASENGNFFTLDSTSLGVLDQNRLGI